mmetsp:Transcript_84420/g.212962  ORF Transcript_84420/g.212962 Transcript_84420/m.212962 type:complete len:160 (-) Transcript_84420:194-673(-)
MAAVRILAAVAAVLLSLSEPATGALVVHRAGVPDPQCRTGVISLKEAGKPQVCCAGYCGECTDYATCRSVRGQNSTLACCASEVYNIRCGAGAPANLCLKKCSESVPPCIMDGGKVFTTPDPSTRTAGSDCNEAVSKWRESAKAAIKAAPATTKKPAAM